MSEPVLSGASAVPVAARASEEPSVCLSATLRSTSAREKVAFPSGLDATAATARCRTGAVALMPFWPALFPRHTGALPQAPPALKITPKNNPEFIKRWDDGTMEPLGRMRRLDMQLCPP